jgi:hypothetical protein
MPASGSPDQGSSVAVLGAGIAGAARATMDRAGVAADFPLEWAATPES